MHSENELHLNKSDFFRNVCIGLVDGLTIPLALAAGLSGLVSYASPVIIACVVAALAGALTMAIGGYLEGRRYISTQSPALSAITIGAGYLCGGLIVTLPYIFIEYPLAALRYSAIAAMVLLFVAGYGESKLNGSKGWTNAIRVCVTAAIVATAAFLLAKLFH
jgi:VIT1/CCC1 family predicted Fe2+/Mn2+ transporter